MGCHTWFYRKSEHQPHYEEVREKLMDLWKKELGYYERHVSNTLSEDEAWLFEDKTVESSEYSIKVLTRLLRILKKDYAKLQLCVERGKLEAITIVKKMDLHTLK